MRFWYLESRSNFSIGIGAETFFSENETFFSKIFEFSQQRTLTILICGSKISIIGPFMMKIIPSTIGNQISSMKWGFGISHDICRNYQPIWVSVLVVRPKYLFKAKGFHYLSFGFDCQSFRLNIRPFVFLKVSLNLGHYPFLLGLKEKRLRDCN